MKKWYKHRLAEMKIFEDLTMERVYNVINNYMIDNKKLEAYPKIPIDSKYTINVYYKDESSIRFSIDKENFSVFIIPVKYEIFANEEKIYLDIVSISQLKQIITEYSFNKALIFCPQCNNNYFSLTYKNLKDHESHYHVCIKESIFLKKLSKDLFNNLFKEKFYFINQDVNPLKFEPNFKLYFKDSDIILQEKNLHIFEDKYQNRMKIINKIDTMNATESLIHIFGPPGKGKTLGLIGILKYIIDHINVGTFYINCKALSNLEKPLQIKQVIIDEIPFLFYGNYNDYFECANLLINYNYNKKNSSFFDLINLVMEQIIKSSNKKNEYIIVLDQYNDKFDKEGKELEKLYNKLILKKEEKIKETTFCLLTFSSMNNKDIRQYKIQYIENILENENDKGHSLCEIDNLEYNLTIDKGGIYDQNLKKLGYGLKYYNILKYFHSEKKTKNMSMFMEKTKSRIRENLLSFFNIN